jgi:hypothetical protein
MHCSRSIPRCRADVLGVHSWRAPSPCPLPHTAGHVLACVRVRAHVCACAPVCMHTADSLVCACPQSGLADLDALRAQFMAVQKQGTVKKLSERTCVQIVSKLIESGKLEVCTHTPPCTHTAYTRVLAWGGRSCSPTHGWPGGRPFVSVRVLSTDAFPSYTHSLPAVEGACLGRVPVSERRLRPVSSHTAYSLMGCCVVGAHGALTPPSRELQEGKGCSLFCDVEPCHACVCQFCLSFPATRCGGVGLMSCCSIARTLCPALPVWAYDLCGPAFWELLTATQLLGPPTRCTPTVCHPPTRPATNPPIHTPCLVPRPSQVLHTMNGKEYVTPDRLKREIRVRRVWDRPLALRHAPCFMGVVRAAHAAGL